MIIASHPETVDLLARALDLEFEDGEARTGELILRKQIMPGVKQELEDDQQPGPSQH